jgi:predicted dehydrogenase
VAQLKVGIIGCGGRGREHALGYKEAADKVKIVAVADPVLESAQKLAETYGVENIHQDYKEMLANNQLDIVSVCTWPEQHREQVVDAFNAGAKAIHCEKPMAPTWGEARAMHQAAEEAGVQLTFCHQRRFNPPFIKTRELLQSGAIGELQRLEGHCSTCSTGARTGSTCSSFSITRLRRSGSWDNLISQIPAPFSVCRSILQGYPIRCSRTA